MPYAVIWKGDQAIVNFEEIGLYLVEISHRPPTAMNFFFADTKVALISLLNVSNNYETLFMVHLLFSRIVRKAYEISKEVNPRICGTEGLDCGVS